MKSNYRSILVPKKGLVIFLTEDNISLYSNVIQAFEQEEEQIVNLLDTKYRFKKSYFFVLGDNIDNSLDSRSFGFVPEEYILGQVVLGIRDYSSFKVINKI